MREERKTRNGQKVAEASLGVTSGSGQQGTEGKFLLPTPDKYLMYVVVRPPSGFWGEINTKKTRGMDTNSAVGRKRGPISRTEQFLGVETGQGSEVY